VGELARAAGTHEVNRPMKVDVGPAREFLRRLLVVPCPPKHGPEGDFCAVCALRMIAAQKEIDSSSSRKEESLAAPVEREQRLSDRFEVDPDSHEEIRVELEPE
jgi:hypothetical protein